ncbi:glycoside hydrolase family 5 protein [Rhypophila decipiens]|uniref:Endoglucanase EG-II n=1 Tax=Rhypophila decipiens TaxID=261697 RepID=A0AAN6Y5R0_9PEZI|nr:glycoside hydrolase family 5 protein [Rhypophila decipiens]
MKTNAFIGIQFFLLATSAASQATTTTTSLKTSTTTAVSCSSNSPVVGGKFTYLGTNIDGFEWGTSTDGTQDLSVVRPPLTRYGGQDGPGQMRHFVKEGFNTFRLAVGWAYLTGGPATGTLNSANLAKFDEIVTACLNTGAYCIVDVHTYARFNGRIIGQGGPSNSVFASLWTSLANHYKGNSRIIFDIMNEPHDVPSTATWAQTVQAAVTAIRNTGASSQIILLPGNGWQSAASFLKDGSAEELLKVTNPDGSTANLVFNLHKYLDVDGSGSHAECVSNWINDGFAPIANWLRCHSRTAMVTETGGGNVQSCITYFCQLMTFLQKNSDVFLGVTGWGAANMALDFATSMTPFPNGTDQLLVQRCYLPYAPS